MTDHPVINNITRAFDNAERLNNTIQHTKLPDAYIYSNGGVRFLGEEGTEWIESSVMVSLGDRR